MKRLSDIFNPVADGFDRAFEYIDDHFPRVANFLDRACDYADEHPDAVSAAKIGGIVGLAVVNPIAGSVCAGIYLANKYSKPKI